MPKKINSLFSSILHRLTRGETLCLNIIKGERIFFVEILMGGLHSFCCAYFTLKVAEGCLWASCLSLHKSLFAVCMAVCEPIKAQGRTSQDNSPPLWLLSDQLGNLRNVFREMLRHLGERGSLFRRERKLWRNWGPNFIAALDSIKIPLICL